MSQSEYGPTNSLDVIKPFIERVADAGDVHIMGGVGTAALGCASVEINSSAKEVWVPGSFVLPTHREDGTKRDVDVLVLSSDKNRVAEVAFDLQETVGDALEQSVFDIRSHETLQKQLAHPLGFRAFRTFLSDRYEASSETSGTYVKSLFPFSLALPNEVLETWTLRVGNDETGIPIPHPGTTLSNYTSRSISGLRPRDAGKITHVAENVFAMAPEIKEWLIDGPGQSQLELSKVIASLRSPEQEDFHLIDGLTVDTYSFNELVEHPAFMFPEKPQAYKYALLGEAAFKAHGLHAFESMPWVVTAWRHLMERRADTIVKNS